MFSSKLSHSVLFTYANGIENILMCELFIRIAIIVLFKEYKLADPMDAL